MVKSNRKIYLILFYLISIFFPPLIILPIILQINWKRKEREFEDELKKIGFNNYEEIETGSTKYLILNDDGRFMQVKGYGYELYDIRNYKVEFLVPDNSGVLANALLAYHVAGPVGALAASNIGNNYLVLRKKGNLEEPLKIRIYGKKAAETLLNYLFYFKEKEIIQ